jgi:hypothetical protein
MNSLCNLYNLETVSLCLLLWILYCIISVSAFCDKITELAAFYFLSNTLDASPMVLETVLCTKTPVFCNENECAINNCCSLRTYWFAVGNYGFASNSTGKRLYDRLHDTYET